MEYKIGTVDEISIPNQKYQSKFIIVKEDQDLVFHARTWYRSEGPIHAQIAREVGVEDKNVFGGGFVGYDFSKGPISEDQIYTWGDSTDFGGVPKEVMERFVDDLLEKYQTINPEIKSIGIDNVCREHSQQKWDQMLAEME